MLEEEKSIEINEARALPTTAMEPDNTFSRYQSMSEFKKSRKKQAPYEKLDYSVYKPSANMVAFSTSQERLIKWIQALYFRYYLEVKTNPQFNVRWEEQEEGDDASKCKKVQITLSHCANTSMDNLITITIYITTGRIQVQGKVIKEWGNSEFVSLVKIVDSKSELKLQISTQQLHESLDELKKVNENVKKDRNKSNG